jgi:hypothetical protein
MSRTAFYRWKKVADAYGLAALLMAKSKRAPAIPNATPTWVVEELLAEPAKSPTGDVVRGRRMLGGVTGAIPQLARSVR